MAENNHDHQPQPFVWQRIWFQRLLVILVVLAITILAVPSLVAVIYAIRAVLLPVLIGLALAYAADPLATWAKRRAKIPRPISAILFMVGVCLLIAGLLLYLVPKLITQGKDLFNALPDYIQQLAGKLNINLTHLVQLVQERATSQFAATTQPTGAAESGAGTAQSIDLSAVAASLVKWLGAGFEVIGSTLGYATYLVLAIVIIAFCFFFFLWKFDAITGWFLPFVPESKREHTLDIIRKMDASVSGFIRGRLIQATSVAVVLSVGWSIAGVPYWLLLGVAGGVLNLIPYAAVVVWPIAILLAWLDSMTGGTGAQATFSFWHVLIWPTVVYMIAQGLDGWVVEPLVQGKATNLDPLTVLLVVLVGGSVGGLLGLLIAIPTAACVKILAKEVFLPQIRAWASNA